MINELPVIGPAVLCPSGLPGRKLTSNLPGSGGEWLQLYRDDQQRRFDAIVCSDSSSTRETGSTRRVLKRRDQVSQELRSPPRPVLDGFYLLQVCHVEDPSDLCNCNIAGYGFEEARCEDLGLFDNVIRVDAAENRLPFECMASFPVLTELHMPLNEIQDIGFRRGQFQDLEIVDLSYNKVSADAILMLGLLPRLKLLNLCGNGIEELPVEMSRPCATDSWAVGSVGEDGQILRYQCLETLVLADNFLSDVMIFAVLAGLKSLKTLDLDGNQIFAIPELKLLGHAVGNKLVNSTFPQLNSVNGTGEILQEMMQNTDQSVGSLFSSPLQRDREDLTTLADNREIVNPGPRSKHQPFPSLRTLSLANNQVFKAEGILHVVCWPVLEEVVVHGNPFTVKSRGMPPVLEDALVSKGIKVIRTKPQVVQRPLVRTSADKFMRIKESSVPTLPRSPLALPSSSRPHALQDTSSPGRPHSLSKHPALPPITKEGHRQDVNDDGKAETVESNETQSNGQGVFLTQVDDDDDDEMGSDSEGADTRTTDIHQRERVEKTIQNCGCESPEKFIGYEALLDAQPDPTITVPDGVQATARELKRLVHNPVHLPDSSSQLNKRTSLKHSYLQKKHQTQAVPVDTRQTRAAELQSLLHEMKSNVNVVEKRLDSVLGNEDDPSLQRAGKKLLSQVQAKYDEVRERSICPALNSLQLNQVSPVPNKEQRDVLRHRQQKLL